MKKTYTLIIAILFLSQLSQAQCTANFSHTNTGPVFDFTDQSTTTVGSIVNWIWYFGDGGGSSQQNPQHIYTANGKYKVTLNITTSSFCNKTFADSVTVTGASTNGNCFAGFMEVDLGIGAYSFVPDSFNLTQTHSWDYGDGTIDSNIPTGANVYTVSGTYTVCHYVTDLVKNCADTVCKPITVNVVGIVEQNKTLSVSVSPNPASDNFNLSIAALKNEKLNVELYDLIGNNLGNIFTGSAITGKNSIPLEFPANLSPGSYLLKVSSGTEILQKLIIKN